MTFTINKEYLKSTIKAPRNSAKTGLRPNAMLLVYNLQQIFVCRVDVQSIFKNGRRNKNIYTKCKSEKIPEAGSTPRVIDLK